MTGAAEATIRATASMIFFIGVLLFRSVDLRFGQLNKFAIRTRDNLDPHAPFYQ
jgi:hypothetical protein